MKGVADLVTFVGTLGGSTAFQPAKGAAEKKAKEAAMSKLSASYLKA